MKIEKVTLQPGLYITATPIGNLKDITLRALEVLESVDFIICEDTRVTNKLLTHYGIKKKMFVYNDHSDSEDRERIISELAGGKSIALVSDAGTPLVSDPGYKLVREVSEQGFYITTIPGASSVISGLVLSALPTDNFFFAGFPPPKKQARIEFFKELSSIKSTIILLIRNNALPEIIQEMNDVIGDRETAVAREITKKFEEVKKGKLYELLKYYQENGEPKGEVVLVLAPPEKKQASGKEIDEFLLGMMEKVGTKEAAEIASAELGISKKLAYTRVLELKNGEQK